MSTFQYRALQANGSVAEGVLEANGRGDAFKQMESRGLRPISLTERNGGVANTRTTTAAAKPIAPKETKPALKPAAKSPGRDEAAKVAKPATPPAPAPATSLGFSSNKITPRMLENFTRLLSSLLAAGVPLSRALVILQREAASPAAQAKWKEIHDLVVDGMTLADAMAKSPDVFPRVYVAMVEAGETGGFLDVVLKQIADFQASEKEMKGKVMTAMLYPAILLVLAIGVLIFLLVFFIPRFQLVFAGFGAKLPLLTQVIIAASDVLRSYGLFLLLGTLLGGYMARNWVISPTGRRSWEGFILRVPTIGSLVAEFAMSRFCRMLGTLLGAGVPLIACLNVARRSIGNQILVDAVTHSIERVKEGKALGPSLGDCRVLFSGSTLEMISVAEESGKLDAELIRIADVTEGDLDRQLKTAVAMAEPLMLFVIAAFIGTIFIGMVIPIFTLQEHIK
ncbi:MAG: type II secretion system F family protein [Proteobacteria bacterium]|nr:type II secretion system F family protein [Verrucomicrobiota bacterium]NBU09390.1 type II secretion system F family protein [Pseudomonadota bacterium]